MAKKRGTNTGIPGLSFSPKRALGITKVKRSIAKKTGIPTTRSGMQRKLGRAATGGCLTMILILILTTILLSSLIVWII